MTQTATPSTEPIAGTWDADAVHSTIEFVTRYLMTTKVRGGFTQWSATLVTGTTPEESRVEATIQTASLTTNNEQRDGHLRSADFFEAEAHPTITFASTAISGLQGDRFTVTGDLTMHGVTRPVTLDVQWLGNVAKDLYGNTRTTFSATTEIDREAWGLTWNAALETGGFLVSKKVTVEIEIQFVLRKDQPQA
ncbi:MAG: YceI family protein [Candidatus Dormibacteria bacterium]